MQYDPTKINFNHPNNIHANQYLPVNQPQFGTGNIYQPYQSPPPYTPYPSQRTVGDGYVVPNVQYYGQPPTLYPQQSLVILRTYRSFWMNHILTKITPNIRAFFIISGIIYMIWCLAIIGLEIAITIESYWTIYHSIWANGIILGVSICMLVVTCQTSYSMITLIRVFSFGLCFCLFGVVLSAVDYANSEKCSPRYSSKYTCDTVLVNILKLINMILFIVITIHTLINIMVFSNIHKNTLKSAVPNN